MRIYLFSFLIPFVFSLEYQLFDTSQLSPSSFFEQFDYETLKSSPWELSKAKKFDEGRKEMMAYEGEWELKDSDSKVARGLDGDKSLTMMSRARHHAITRFLDKEVSGTNGVFVVQYEVKFENSIDCSGSYIKLFSAESPEDLSFDSYEVMFGPDICSTSNSIKMLLHDGDVSLKHPPMSRKDELSNLYTLIIDNGKLSIRINGQVAKAGNITNPRFVKNSSKFTNIEPITAIGFELWLMDAGILFNNIYVGNSIEEAELIGNSTWKPKYELEVVQKREYRNNLKIKHPPAPPPKSFDDLIEEEKIDFLSYWYLIFPLIFIAIFFASR